LGISFFFSFGGANHLSFLFDSRGDLIEMIGACVGDSLRGLEKVSCSKERVEDLSFAKSVEISLVWRNMDKT
jgi:hypothetical protein